MGMFKGLRDWLNRIQGHGFVNQPRSDVFILGGDIGLNSENYSSLVQALRKAKEGDKIYIVLLENEGGLANIGYNLHDEIMDCKGIVHTEARMWSASAALDVLFSGDYVYIPKHNSPQGFGVAHLSYVGSAYHKIRDPRTMQEDMEKMQFYRPFLTDEQWQRVCDGEDVNLFGKEMCSIADKKTIEDDNHCVIKRNKRYDK